MSKGPKNLNSTQTTTMDPTLQNRQDDLWKRAQGLADQPYQPYTGQRYGDPNADMLASWRQAGEAAGAGQDELSQAQGGLMSLLGGYGAGAIPNVNAGQIDPSELGGAYRPMQVGAQRVSAGSIPNIDLSRYLNPYTNDVVNTSLSDIDRARQAAQAQTTGQALGAHAFGGSRSGIAAGLTNAEYGRTAAGTAANLRNLGFTNAAGLATSDLNRAFAASQGNQAADLQAQQGNQFAGLQSGLDYRRGLLQMLQGNQSAGLTASMANAQNRLAGGNLRLNAANAMGALGGQRQAMLGYGADILNRAGAQRYGIGQANRDFQYQQFREQRDLPYRNLGVLNDILSSGRYGSTTTGTRTNPNQGSFFGGLLGLGSTLAGIPGIGNIFGSHDPNIGPPPDITGGAGQGGAYPPGYEMSYDRTPVRV